MREQFIRAVDAVGARAASVRTRDRLVDLLTGDWGHPEARRNRKDNYHLSLLLRFNLRPSSNYLDVGANQGHFLRGLSRIAPLGHHIAYEPLPNLCERLTQRFPEVEIRQAALSNENAEAPFTHVVAPGNQGYSNLVHGGLKDPVYPAGLETRTITVRTERLDDHLPEGWLPHIIKVDVEGAERLVFEGAMETLRRAKPIVAFEHLWDPDGSAEIYRLLSDDVGLRIFDMDGHGPLDRSQFFDELASRWNFIAHE